MIGQILAATIGSTGFAIFLKMKGKQIVFAGLGGMATWWIYLICENAFGGLFVPNLIASIFAGVFAEVMARVNRAPATIFLTAAAVPLIPGGMLYYTMLGLVTSDEKLFAQSGRAAVVIALAISLGFVIVAIISKYVNRLIRK